MYPKELQQKHSFFTNSFLQHNFTDWFILSRTPPNQVYKSLLNFLVEKRGNWKKYNPRKLNCDIMYWMLLWFCHLVFHMCVYSVEIRNNQNHFDKSALDVLLSVTFMPGSLKKLGVLSLFTDYKSSLAETASFSLIVECSF